MKKLLSAVILHVLLLPAVKAQSKLFDQQVQLKSCNISIEANLFTATTFIEMEFYNPKDQEVEGYQSFRLNKGQVVSAFQLDLNGKYRDGSIEEKWKANRAYSSIVGKRIDPAILQMNYDNSYSLRIYPIPAHAGRKVTMTIDQLMTEDSSMLNYQLPLNFSSNTETFHLEIRIANSESVPVSNDGIIGNQLFNIAGNAANIEFGIKNIILNKPISFSIPLRKDHPQVCISKQDNVTNFLLRIFPAVPRYYRVKPKTASIFWDVSTSSGTRDIKKELDFLESYILANGISIATVTLFNHEIRRTMIVAVGEGNFIGLRNYLLNYHYSGATTFGNLPLSECKDDVILIFSDGRNSFGGSTPTTSTVQVNCVVSTRQYDEKQLEKIISSSGGAIININNIPVATAIKKIELAQNFLMRYNSTGGSVKLNEKFPILLSKNILLSGTFNTKDNLQLVYGNSGTINKVENIYLSVADNCNNALYKKIQMLKSYDSIVNEDNWQEMVFFGLREKVVTPRTSFLVLERIEDYIKYNIAPPKELEEECAERNYVYKSEYKIQALKIFSEQDALQNTVTSYNRYLKWWSASESPIDLNKSIASVNESPYTETGTNQNMKGAFATANNTIGENGSNTIKEVIVTSAFQTKRSLRSQTSSIQNVHGEQLNPTHGPDLNNALAGKVAGVQVQSQSGVALGRETMVRLRGENGLGVGRGPIYVVDGTVMPGANDINPDDIESVTVLQGPAATVLFGAEACNGAIVITNKKARRNYYGYYSWSDYKLKNVADVEYLDAIKIYDKRDLWSGYVQLERAYYGQPGFYFDMAEYFFEKKLKKIATDILFEAIEACKGEINGLRGAAFIFESWKNFDAAIKIYQDIIERSPNDMISRRDLALAYYQNGEYQKAVDTYYKIISTADGDFSYYHRQIKIIAMNEMNAIIISFRHCLDLGSMNMNLIKYLPVDLRIIVENSSGYFNDIRIIKDQGEQYPSSAQFLDDNTYNSRGYQDYYHSISECSIRNAAHGVYKVKVNSYNEYSNYAGRIPAYLRIVVFKNFQRPNQTMEVQHIAMDNQYGSVEVAAIKW